jgi:hypothetical protein
MKSITIVVGGNYWVEIYIHLYIRPDQEQLQKIVINYFWKELILIGD